MYATPSDLGNRYGRDAIVLAANLDIDSDLDSEVVKRALQDATDEIDTYLANRYELPLSIIPGVLVRCCCDIAMYRLSPTGNALTDEKRVRYEDTLKLLEKLASGKAQLVLKDSSSTSDNTNTNDENNGLGVGVELSASPRLFTRKSTAGVL